jgi:hypothetical protein
MFHPVDGLAVQPFLNGDVGHGGVGSGAVPMLLSGREPDYVAGVNLFDGATFVLRPSAACGDDEGLAERVGVPCSPRAGLEGDAGAGDKRRIRGLKEGVNADGAGKPIRWALGGGLGADALDVHGAILVHLRFTSWHQSFSQDGFFREKPPHHSDFGRGRNRKWHSGLGIEFDSEMKVAAGYRSGHIPHR